MGADIDGHVAPQRQEAAVGGQSQFHIGAQVARLVVRQEAFLPVGDPAHRAP